MAPKDKPYSENNKPRPVSFGANYSKRQGSEFFSANVTGKYKDAEATVGYTTTQEKTKRPYVSTRHRQKELRATGKVPIGKDTRLKGSVTRQSDKGVYNVDSPYFKGSGMFGNKPVYGYEVGLEKDMLGGTGSLGLSHTPGQESIGRKQQSAIKAKLSIPFNKGGKVKKRRKRNKRSR
mgnify:CR=1 FL=1